jgi:mono/diheme cytochrome c family protein
MRLPETQSALSRWIVRGEVMLTIVLAAGIIVSMRRAAREDESPVRVSIGSTLSISPELMAAISSAPADDSGDTAKGRALYLQTCTACHGQNAQGMPHMGVNLRQSKFISTSSDRKLQAFIRGGRAADHPSNTTGLPMPARGGNVSLDDDSLADIVAFLRSVQEGDSVQE